MAPRICTHCLLPHVTTDWYVIDEHKHPCRGDVECVDAHERRIVEEVRDGTLVQRALSAPPKWARRPRLIAS
jgi:hypothetical protein